ncbi:Subtilisin NAT precursor [Streptomyces sp. ADI97-07]|nr:Subtilisin NAT precursor [Streptomyces sp. ADI97-07]
MRKRSKKAYAVVAAAAVVLTAGMTGPASSTTTSPDTPSPVEAEDLGTAGRTVHTVTLITGDRVDVDSRGRVGGIERAKGREDMPFFTRTQNGHTYAVPRDARRLIADGTLDQRLFDVTELAEPEARKANRAGLKVIVGYRGSAAKSARAGVRSSDGTTLRRTLSALDADAVTSAAATDSKGSLWDALTREQNDGSAATTSGIAQIWLDGSRKASLDRSTAQIGAPAAWARSYDGSGVKIAVVDTGIDATHPDLTGRVVAERNFSGSPDARDRVGHGTHVASVAAGAGSKDARFKGVAPGAQLINAKVLDDRGVGDDSGILAGVDWAVAQGADVINMSLGSPDTLGIDPLEAQVNKLSAEKGVLFAIAAGNSGPGRGTVASPGSADAALTVGAVDDDGLMADFSSVGPRTGDGAVKPDITAPGVEITAAAATGTSGQNPPGYVSLSGTSMATPHVAGAAAILKQKNPTWTGSQIKAVLTGSAKDGSHSVFQQGAGRLTVDKAIDQTLVSEPGSVVLGTQAWPHTDDTPVTKQVRYRNNGTADVTLDLSLAAPTSGDGQPAPTGFFTLGAQRITVPAGGDTVVDLTADTRLGGTVDGSYSTTVVASGDGQTVRTAAAVERESESYDVTFKTVGRDGAASTTWQADLKGYRGSAAGQRFFPDLSSGTTTVRLPPRTRPSHCLPDRVLRTASAASTSSALSSAARASKREISIRSSTRTASLPVSALIRRTARAVSGASVPASSSTTSVTASIPASGVRNSCETSEAKRRARAPASRNSSTERSRRAADSLNVLARSAISSRPCTGMRVSSCPPPMERAARRSSRTGRNTLRDASSAGTRATASPGSAPSRAAVTRALMSTSSFVMGITAKRTSPLGTASPPATTRVITGIPIVRYALPSLTTRSKLPCGDVSVVRRSSWVRTPETGRSPEEARNEPYSAKTIHGWGLARAAMS